MRLSIPSSLPGQAITVDKSLHATAHQEWELGFWAFGIM